MNMDRYTDRVKQVLQAAQSDALMRNHTLLTGWHIVAQMLQADDGAENLIGGPGVMRWPSNRPAARRWAKWQPSRAARRNSAWRPDLAKGFALAEKQAGDAGDSFVTQERLLAALLGGKDDVAKALQAAKLTPQNLQAAIADLRQAAPPIAPVPKRPMRR